LHETPQVAIPSANPGAKLGGGQAVIALVVLVGDTRARIILGGGSRR
jgi:hypothetical protein